MKHYHTAKKASILVGLLWCMALLSLIVVGVLHTARMDLLVVKNYGDRIQAHYLALAGVEKAKALLYQDAHDRSRSRQNHNGNLYNNSEQFRDIAFGRGMFRVMRRARDDEGGGVLYGISDEESRLNVNTASQDQLTNLDQLTPDIAASIIDWRDADNQVTPGGAEADYYNALQPPYQPRNGPFQTVRELLMVKGISRELLLGSDLHMNGMLEPADESDDESGPENAINSSDLGWAASLTVDSSVKNVNAAGEQRLNIQNADESSLAAVQGFNPAIARAIVAYRGQHQFQSLADLLDVTAQNPSGTSPQNRQASGRNGAGSSSGPRVVSEDLLMDVADELTTDSNQQTAGLVNVNTASLEVLSCLPGVDRQLAQAIISFRQSNGFLANIAWLMKVPGMSRDIFKQLAPLVTVRSETFRILSEGKVNSSGARQRLQVIVHVDGQDIQTLSYREDDL